MTEKEKLNKTHFEENIVISFSNEMHFATFCYDINYFTAFTVQFCLLYTDLESGWYSQPKIYLMANILSIIYATCNITCYPLFKDFVSSNSNLGNTAWL